VESLVTVRIEWTKDAEGRHIFKEIEGTQQAWPTQLVLLAMGFVGPEKRGAISDLNLEMDARGNVKTDGNYMTSAAGVFAAGDLRRGQSLVVWAIHEGREAARAVDKFLMGVSHLPSVNAGDFAWK
jgi:glutamate synthase (NADPH/NADH) small chain